MIRIASIADVIDREVAPALGEFGDDYDLEAIAREAFEFRTDCDDRGNLLLDTQGFEQIVSEEEFWEIVERHAKR